MKAKRHTPKRRRWTRTGARMVLTAARARSGSVPAAWVREAAEALGMLQAGASQ